MVLLFLSLSNLWSFCYSSIFHCNPTFQGLGLFVHSSFKLMVLLFVIGLIVYSFFKLSIFLLYNSTSQAFGVVIRSFFQAPNPFAPIYFFKLLVFLFIFISSFWVFCSFFSKPFNPFVIIWFFKLIVLLL